MGGIQISGSGTIVPNEYIKPCIDEIFQVFKKHFPEEMQTTEIITVILNLAKEKDGHIVPISLSIIQLLIYCILKRLSCLENRCL